MPSISNLSVLARTLLAIYFTLNAAISFADIPSCEDKLVANVNASTAIQDYRQTNHRPFIAYAHKFGPKFLHFFVNPHREVRWLESGGGYGLAPLEMVRVNPKVHASVINSQDAWPYILNVSKEESRNLRGTLTRMGKLMGARMDDIVEDSQVPCYAEGWFERLMPRLREKHSEISGSGRFEYHVGLAEQVLPDMEGDFQLITDMFGAYFYSAARLQLLNQYYLKLGEGGEAFIVFFSEDRHLQFSPARVDAYGPRNLIVGTKKSLEELLVELYPQIFRVIEISSPDGIIKSLHMTKIEGMRLNLTERLEIIESKYDHAAELPISRQIPNIRIRRHF